MGLQEEKTDRFTGIVIFLLGGLAGIPPILFLGKTVKPLAPVWLLFASVFGVFCATMIAQILGKKHWSDVLKEGFIGAISFGIGGIVPMVIEFLVPDRWVRIGTSMLFTILLGLIVLIFWNDESKEKPGKVPRWVIALIVVILFVWVGVATFFAHLASKADRCA